MTPARTILLCLLLPLPLVRGAVDFNRDVRPILSDRCFACHGPDAEKRKAGLRLDTMEGATAVLKSGNRAIVPGKSKTSALFERIHSTDPDEIMPPAKLNRPLSAAERGCSRAGLTRAQSIRGTGHFLRPGSIRRRR